ncbi:MAG TPA: hypothetical protein DHW63_03020 [Hyphomonadaceae bacterium]|nr:hypothetical protein [Hyphomonadaceae bacterium]
MTKANGREEYGVTTLCRKRAEIVSEIGEKEIALQNLVLQLGHLDAALRIMRPEIALPALPDRHLIRRSTKRGDVSRPVIQALHEARGPLTVKELARAMLIAHGKPAQRVSEEAKESVRSLLRQLRKRGDVRPMGLDGPSQTWELVRE